MIALFCNDLNKQNANFLGFLLLAGDTNLPNGKSSRDGILTGLASSATQGIFADFFHQYKHQEFSCQIDKDQSNLKLQFQLDDYTVFIDLLGDNTGQWYFEQSNNKSPLAYCELAKIKI